MSFQPKVNEEILINGVTYRVAEHLQAPGMVYGQEGRQAVVYQLVSGTDQQALKVFKRRYQVPSLVALAERLAPFAALPGLVVCQRTVLTPQRQSALLRQHPDLTYAVLMSWVAGPTWLEVMLNERTLAPEESLQLARAFADILSSMEQRGLAHCDLSGSNILLPIFADAAPRSLTSAVDLVDIEQMYGPGLDRPEVLPIGSPGYAHRAAGQGLWTSSADRFAGAILLAEMLGWCDQRVRAAAWGESYFDPAEMQQPGERARLLSTVLTDHWGSGVARLFEQAWASRALAECPTFGIWLVTLPEHRLRPPALTDAAASPTPAPPFVADSITMLLSLAAQLEERANWDGAMQIYRQAFALLAPGSVHADEIKNKLQNLEPQPIPSPYVLSPIPQNHSPVLAASREDAVRLTTAEEHIAGGSDSNRRWRVGTVGLLLGLVLIISALLGSNLLGRPAVPTAPATQKTGPLTSASTTSVAKTSIALSGVDVLATPSLSISVVASMSTPTAPMGALTIGLATTTAGAPTNEPAAYGTVTAEAAIAEATAAAMIRAAAVAATEQARATTTAAAVATAQGIAVAAEQQTRLTATAAAKLRSIAAAATQQVRTTATARTARQTAVARQATAVARSTLEAGAAVARRQATVAAAAVATEAAARSPILTAPTLLQPADGAILPRGGAETIAWSPVPNAVSYVLERTYENLESVPWQLNCSDGKSAYGRSCLSSETGTRTVSSVPFAYKVRWRVWAIDVEGHAGPQSEWRTYSTR